MTYKKGFRDGYEEALRHVKHGIRHSDNEKANKLIKSIEYLIKSKFWKKALKHKERSDF